MWLKMAQVRRAQLLDPIRKPIPADSQSKREIRFSVEPMETVDTQKRRRLEIDGRRTG